MKRALIVLAVVVSSLCAGVSWGAQVPGLINYQSVLFDDGGNVLEGDSADIAFRITDIAGATLYEEYQTVDMVNGTVSAMVGNGLDANGAPTGGISAEALDPATEKYLEVNVGNYDQGAMEIVSVPYAMYAQEAMSVAAGSIDGDAIMRKSITLDHLADAAIDELGDTLVSEGGMVDLTTLQAASGASNVGVQSGLTYSTGDNVQRVVADLDAAIAQRKSEDDSLSASIDQEKTDRMAADDSLVSVIDQERLLREAADSSESQTRATADQNHDNSISQLQTDINDRVSRLGDQMSGTYALCGDLAINCSGNLTVDGTDVGDALSQYAASINVNRMYFGGLKVIAWGVVDGFGGLVEGENVSVAQNAIGKYTVSFIDSPSNANYAVIINSTHVSENSNVETATYSKSTGSFSVHGWFDNGGIHPSNSAFDFVVIGRQ